MSEATVLIVEDDGILAIHLEDLLKRQGYATLKPISSGEEAIVAVNSLKPSIILMDIELSGKMNGITAAEVISKTSGTPVIFLTGFSQDPMLERARFAAPYGYLVKPVPERELAAAIEMALYKHQLDHQVRASNAKYISLIEQASDGIFLADMDGNYIEVNSAFCELLGYSREELLRLKMQDIIHAADLATKSLKSLEFKAGPETYYERRLNRKDGTCIPVEISRKILDGGGYQGIVRDITQRKEEEEKIRNSREALNKAQAVSHVGSWEWNIQDDILTWSDEMYNIFGIDKENFTGKLDEVIPLRIHPDDIEKVTNSNTSVRDKSIPIPLEYRVVLPDKSVRDVWAEAGEMITDASGKTIRLTGIVQDITERKRMEDSLRKSEEWSRFILDHANDGIHIDTPEDKIIHVNSRLCEMMGYTKEDLLKMSVSDLIAPEFRSSQNNILIENLALHGTIPFESVNLHSSGRRIPVEVSISKFATPDGERYISIVRDISERYKNEEQTRKQEKLIRTVFDTVPVGIFIVNEEGNISLLNPAGKEIWGDVRYVGPDGLDEYKGWWRSTGERVASHEWGSARAFEKGERVENEEIEIESFNGEHKIISNSAYPLFDENNKINGAVVVLQDITEKIKFDEELQKRNDYLVAIQESSIELIEQLDLDRLLENICYRAGQMMNTNSSVLDLVDPGTGQLIPHIGLGAMTDSLKYTAQPGQGMSGIVWQTKEPILIEDYDNWDGRLEDFPKTVIQSILGVPLISGEEVLGVLGLAHEFGSINKFDPESVQYLYQFARLATIAIKNARIHTIAQQELADRKAAEKALLESEQRFHQMFAEHNATMLLINPDTGEIIDANPAASRFYGYSVDKLRTMLINKINLLQIEVIKDAYQSVIEHKENILIFPHRLASGEIRTVEVHSSPITVNQKIVLFSIVHDITERSLAEKQVQQQLSELRRWNTVTLGRETRVLELKHEVNGLLAKLGAPSRYQFTKEPDDE